MNKIDFRVPLSGSKLFDINAYATAKKLCRKFPGLNFDYNDNEIHVYGELTDYWLTEFNKIVFEVGTM